VLFRQHLVAEDAAGLAEPRRVERLKSFVDELLDVLAAARAVIIDGLAGEK
jgi:hypothetical protein